MTNSPRRPLSEEALQRRRRRIAVAPALMTLCNGVCGFASIIVASRIHPSALYETSELHARAMEFLGWSAFLIFIGMVFDVLDGHVARLSNSSSRFGAELDSLCDVITFGAAPAFLLLKMGPTPDQTFLYNILFVASTSYVICTILRLARFNVQTGLDEESHRFFKGLPSPAAAGCIASVAVTRANLQFSQQILDLDNFQHIISAVLPFAAIGLALLMVSNIVYPHLINHSLRGRRSFRHLVEIVTFVIAILVFRELTLPFVFWLFALLGPGRRLLRVFTKRDANVVQADAAKPVNPPATS